MVSPPRAPWQGVTLIVIRKLLDSFLKTEVWNGFDNWKRNVNGNKTSWFYGEDERHDVFLNGQSLYQLDAGDKVSVQTSTSEKVTWIIILKSSTTRESSIVTFESIVKTSQNCHSGDRDGRHDRRRLKLIHQKGQLTNNFQTNCFFEGFLVQKLE